MQGQPTTRYARGDVSIAHQVLGTGTQDILVVQDSVVPIEALHDHPAPATFLGRLADWGRVVLFDRRGVGLSDPVGPGRDLSLDDWVADAVAVLDEVGSERAAVIASGPTPGLVAVRLAAAHPERVSALVLYDAIARYRWAPDHPWGVRPEVEAEIVDRVGQGWGAGEVLDRRGRYTAALERHPSAAEWAERWTRRGVSPATALALQAVLHESDLRAVLPGLSVPTLVVNHVGTRDGPYLADRIPDARLLELQDPSHLVFSTEVDTALAAMSELILGSRITPTPERVLATVLFTDIVDSTRALAATGDRAWRTALDAHDQMVRGQLDRFGGHAIKTTGDGFLATFDAPARAVQCGSAIRAGAKEQGLQIRAGVHTGEVERRGDDVAGMAVHVAQRISARAGPGEVLVSRTVVDLVEGSGLAFESQGEHRLKGLDRRWEVFRSLS